MSYRNGIAYLGSKTKVIELCNQFGGRVAVCPDWNGRVMTSTCDGLDGGSFGLINVHAIDHELSESGFDFYGGEDQLTLSPEGGPFSLYYTVGEEEIRHSMKDYVELPTGFTEGVFSVDSVPPDPEVRMRRSLRMTNLAGARFDLDVVRTVRLMESKDVAHAFGSAVAVSLEQTDVSYVGYATHNSLINRGAALTKSSGLVSIRLRSMFNSNANTIAVIPFRSEIPEESGPPICSDFFGSSPHGRLRILSPAALLRADSKYRCQVGVCRKRAMPYLGSIDFREGLLTLIRFDMPPEPWKHDYLCNEYCETVGNTVVDFVNAREFYVRSFDESRTEDAENDPEMSPYAGEVVRAYNHGPTMPGEPLTCFFYEFDVFSPAREMAKGEALAHHQYTLHVNADNRTLAYLVEKIFGVEYEQVFEKMML